MLTDHLFNKKLPLYNRALDAYALRQQIAAKNIANSTTPEYRPESVRFEEEFHKAKFSSGRGLRTDRHHIPLGAPIDSEIKGEKEDAVPKPEVLFSGESHVNVDKEMSQLAQNQIRFRMASRMTGKYFQGLQTAIKGTI
jgi:flagellar basal-body rod protein FlgB